VLCIEQYEHARPRSADLLRGCWATVNPRRLRFGRRGAGRKRRAPGLEQAFASAGIRRAEDVDYINAHVHKSAPTHTDTSDAGRIEGVSFPRRL